LSSTERIFSWHKNSGYEVLKSFGQQYMKEKNSKSTKSKVSKTCCFTADNWRRSSTTAV